MHLNLEGLTTEELAALEHTTRHLPPDHLRSRAAYELGIALKNEIRMRVRYTLAPNCPEKPGNVRS
jgi:hypothetical protein